MWWYNSHPKFDGRSFCHSTFSFVCNFCLSLFSWSESGFLHKAVLLNKDTHIIEEIQVFRQTQLVKNILLSTSKVHICSILTFVNVCFQWASLCILSVAFHPLKPFDACSSYCRVCFMWEPLKGWPRCLYPSARPIRAVPSVFWHETPSVAGTLPVDTVPVCLPFQPMRESNFRSLD